MDPVNKPLIPIGTLPSAPLDSDPGMEHHHPILGTLGGHGGQVKRDINKNQ